MKKGEKYKCVVAGWGNWFIVGKIYECDKDNCLIDENKESCQILKILQEEFKLVIEKEAVMKIEKGNSYLCLVEKGWNGRFFLNVIYKCDNDDSLIDENNESCQILKMHQKEFQLVTDSETPTHYQTKSKLDVIGFCYDYGLNFCKGSAVKYIARAGKKDDEIKDLEKAIDFLQREVKFLKDEVH